MVSILQHKIDNRKQTTAQVDDDATRDLLDIMIDCRNEDGTGLSFQELSDHTRT